jgi:2'-5' RNA ligase
VCHQFMRLFIAIELPEGVHTALAASQAKLRASLGGGGVSWTKPENFHLTLKFIGEWPEQRVVELCESLREILVPALELSLGLAGALPPRGAARVLVVDLVGDVERLVELAAEIDDRCHAVGVPREGRKYRPHVTLGRMRPPRRVERELFAAATPKASGSFRIAEFVLMHSALSPKGSRYTRVASFPLG